MLNAGSNNNILSLVRSTVVSVPNKHGKVSSLFFFRFGNKTSLLWSESLYLWLSSISSLFFFNFFKALVVSFKYDSISLESERELFCLWQRKVRFELFSFGYNFFVELVICAKTILVESVIYVKKILVEYLCTWFVFFSLENKIIFLVVFFFLLKFFFLGFLGLKIK